MWVIVSCHPWTGVVGRMQDAFFPVHQWYLKVSGSQHVLLPPLFMGCLTLLDLKKSGFTCPKSIQIQHEKSCCPLRHSHLSMYSMNLKQQKTTYILIIYISIMWVSNSQVFTSDFQKSYLEQFFFAQMLLIICFEVFSALRKRAE